MPASSEAFKILAQVKKGPNYERGTQGGKEIAEGNPRIQAKSKVFVADPIGERKSRTNPEQIEKQHELANSLVHRRNHAREVKTEVALSWARSRHSSARNAAGDNAVDGVGDDEMQVFDNLHVVRWDDNADVAQGLHFPALES